MGETIKSRKERLWRLVGHVNDPGTDIMSIVKGYDLPIEFPEKGVESGRRRVAKDDQVRQTCRENGYP